MIGCIVSTFPVSISLNIEVTSASNISLTFSLTYTPYWAQSAICICYVLGTFNNNTLIIIHYIYIALYTYVSKRFYENT